MLHLLMTLLKIMHYLEHKTLVHKLNTKDYKIVFNKMCI